MIFIYPRKEGKGRYRQVRLPTTLVLFLSPQVRNLEVSLESIFQVALPSIFSDPADGRQIQVSIQKKYGTILLQFQTVRALEEEISAFEAG